MDDVAVIDAAERALPLAGALGPCTRALSAPILALTSEETIVPGATSKGVIAASAVQAVWPFAASEQVVSHASAQLV